MGIMNYLFDQNKGLVLSALLCMVISAVSNVALINFFRQLLDKGGDFFSLHLWSFFILILATFAFGVLSQWMITTLSYRVVYQLQGKLLQQIIQTEYEHFQKLGKNRLYAVLTKDISNIQSGFTVIPYFFYGSVLTVGVLLYLAVLSIQLTLLMMIGLSLSIAIGRFISNRFHLIVKKARELEDLLFDAYGKILEGHKELLLNETRGVSMVKTVMLGIAREAKNLQTTADRYFTINIHFANMNTIGLIGLVFWVAHAWNWVDMPTAVAFAIGLMYVEKPMSMAINQLPQILSAKVSLQKLASLKLAQFDSTLELVKPMKANWQKIEFQAVQYCYPESKQFDFGPNSLIVNRGELLFLVGKNGSGKSTFIKLLVGLLVPRAGKILIDDQEIDAENRRRYRAMFSAVLADFFLFNQVILENDSQQSYHFLDDMAKQMLKDLQLDKIVDVKRGKMSQIDLSTGQRKRLAMLQSFMERRSIMVLDEWAADQDPYFRQIFYEKLLPKLKEKGITVIVASHDERYFHVADRVIVFEQGEGRSCLSADNILY